MTSTRRPLAVMLSLACAIALTACFQHSAPSKVSDTQLAARAETHFFMTGTIAGLGSFEWDAAPIVTHAAAELHDIPVLLSKGEITVDQAQAIVTAAQKAHDLAQQAVAACAQDQHTGKCTKNEAKARSLLDQARAALP